MGSEEGEVMGERCPCCGIDVTALTRERKKAEAARVRCEDLQSKLRDAQGEVERQRNRAAMLREKAERAEAEVERLRGILNFCGSCDETQEFCFNAIAHGHRCCDGCTHDARESEA